MLNNVDALGTPVRIGNAMLPRCGSGIHLHSLSDSSDAGAPHDTRRDFVGTGSLALGLAMIPRFGHAVDSFQGSLTPIPSADKKALADVA